MIVVRTGITSRRQKLGDMHATYGTASYSGNYVLAGGWDISKSRCRPATTQETEAFKKGVKNINDIKEIALYSIY